MVDRASILTLKVPRSALLAALNGDRRVALAIENLTTDVGEAIPGSLDDIITNIDNVFALIDQLTRIAVSAKAAVDRANETILQLQTTLSAVQQSSDDAFAALMTARPADQFAANNQTLAQSILTRR